MRFQAQSSIPTTFGAGDDGRPVRRTTRNSVSLLTGIMKRGARLAGWPAAEREGQMMNETVEERGSTGAGRENVVTEPFGKNSSAAQRCHAAKAPRRQ